MSIMVTGDRGFIGTYIVSNLLNDGHSVVGIDNESKYGLTHKPWDYDGSKYLGITADVRNEWDVYEAMVNNNVNHAIFGAARIGGISYFHALPYTLLADNEQMMASQFNAAIRAYQEGVLKKVTVISSSMVYEGCTSYPHVEGDELKSPPPHSSYGFQKLATEYFAKAAFDEFGLPYTIVRPFNCVGIGEIRAMGEHEIMSGDVKLAMSHVVPDLIQKIYKGQDPVRLLGSGHQVRQYTHGDDLAKGIIAATFSPNAINETFNLSSGESTTVCQLAYHIWRRLNPNKEFNWTTEPGFKHDVLRREASSLKARSTFGWAPHKGLQEILDEVVPWTIEAINGGLI